MGQTNRRASAWPSLVVLLAVSLSALQPAIADDAPEREQLAALARQLDLIDRIAEHAASTAPQERARYHFDYARLRADLKRVRAGLAVGGVLGEAVEQVELAGEGRQLLVFSAGIAGRCGRCAGQRDDQRQGQGRHTAARGRRVAKGCHHAVPKSSGRRDAVV